MFESYKKNDFLRSPHYANLSTISKIYNEILAVNRFFRIVYVIRTIQMIKLYLFRWIGKPIISAFARYCIFAGMWASRVWLL